MNDLLSMLKSIAPGLATALTGPLGTVAISAMASKLGVGDSVEAVAKAIAEDPDAAVKLREIDLKQFELENQDRDSARKAYTAVATSENATLLEKIVVPVLALGVVGLAFLLIGILMFANIPDSQENIIIYALGFITSAAGQVL
jgi:hypothetical protein